MADIIVFIVCSRHEPYLNRYCLTMDTSHSVCLNVDWLIFLKNRINLWDYRQAFTRFKHDFFKVCGNVNLRHFPTQGGVTLLVSTAILLHSCDFLFLWQMCKPLLYGIIMLFGTCDYLIAILLQIMFWFSWCYSIVALMIEIHGDVFTITLMFLHYWLIV